ncbi:uncharacterized protein LOC110440772, partial [Mizuhopecten yessoensis]|uniref:uncharacterized protein LOC110440772 n=1 Tax=Mizuhopecten yessoensis TaxID=6573 RepID=UPI000B45A79B
YPAAQLSNEDRYPTKSTICMDMSMEDFEAMICSFYPDARLGLTGFHYAKADQGKRLQTIHGETVLGLRTVLKQGKLFIIPKRDLRMETPLLLEEEIIERDNTDTVR